MYGELRVGDVIVWGSPACVDLVVKTWRANADAVVLELVELQTGERVSLPQSTAEAIGYGAVVLREGREL